jgi:hypothetical protein
MRKFLGVLAAVVLGTVGLISTWSVLQSSPEFFAFFSDSVSWLNASLGYEEELVLAVVGLTVAAWAFDREIDRGKKLRKPFAASTFLCAVAAYALLALSSDRLDDSWSGVAIADNRAVAGPPEGGGTVREGLPDNSAKAAPNADQLGGQLASTASSGSAFDSGAFSKGESSSSTGCTCPSAGKFEPPPPQGGSGGGGGAVQSEDAWVPDEGAEEAQEAAEEAEEEREEEAEEAEWESEAGL